jgi:uncharacterized SAM-binding protein YcdF (DUF218 family)
MESVLCRIHDYLNIGTAPKPADCIFVLAGRQERKVFGIELWRQGWAPELILSVGRFEWRKFYALGLTEDGGLKAMVDQTPPVRRHFFVRMDGKGARCQWVQPGWFGTWREAQALAAFVREEPIQSLMVVSDAVHLRRVAVAFRRAFHGRRFNLDFVAVDSASLPAERQSWWQQPESRAYVVKELSKYLVYRAIF